MAEGNGSNGQRAAWSAASKVIAALAIAAVLGGIRHEVLIFQLAHDHVRQADLLRTEQRIKDAFPPDWLRTSLTEIKDGQKQNLKLLLQVDERLKAVERRNQ